MTKQLDLDRVWEILEGNNYFTENELQLCTTMNGYSLDTINDMCYARYGYNDAGELLIEDGIIKNFEDLEA